MTAAATTPTGPQISHALAGAGVLAASVCFGVVPYFTRGLSDQGLAPHAVAFFRYVIAAAVLLPLLWRCRSGWRAILWGIGAGAAMGLGWIGYVTATATAPVSTVGVLYMTYPVFTVILARLLFGDRATPRAVLAAAIILLGAVIAANPAAVPVDLLPVLALSLAAPLGFGFGICVLVHRLTRLPPLARIASVSLGSVLVLAPLMLASEPADVIPQDVRTWVLIAGLAIGTALIPQLVYTICSPVIGAARTAVFGSIELPAMFAVGVIAFNEALTLSQAIGGTLVVAAIILTRSRATRNVSTTLARARNRSGRP